LVGSPAVRPEGTAPPVASHVAPEKQPDAGIGCPEGVDPAVFASLPPDIQAELWGTRDWQVMAPSGPGTHAGGRKRALAVPGSKERAPKRPTGHAQRRLDAWTALPRGSPPQISSPTDTVPSRPPPDVLAPAENHPAIPEGAAAPPPGAESFRRGVPRPKAEDVQWLLQDTERHFENCCEEVRAFIENLDLEGLLVALSATRRRCVASHPAAAVAFNRLLAFAQSRVADHCGAGCRLDLTPLTPPPTGI